MSPPTPSGISTRGVLSPWNIATVSSIGMPVDHNGTFVKDAAASKSEGGASGNGMSSRANSTSSISGWNAAVAASNGATILPQHIMSPRASFASIHSPLSYFHPSPLSPMMLIHSPYASSISSCPSVSSSSGCSSDSGNLIAATNLKNYAPTEYHVGPRRPLCEKLTEEESVSEGANSSGRNTPVGNLEEESGAAPNQNAPEDQPSVLLCQLPNQGPMPPTFTPFLITSQGPSVSQSATHPIPLTESSGGEGGGGGGGTNIDPGDKGQGATKTGNLEATRQATSYPYSVESLTHSVPGQPLSVESSSHVSHPQRIGLWHFHCMCIVHTCILYNVHVLAMLCMCMYKMNEEKRDKSE